MGLQGDSAGRLIVGGKGVLGVADAGVQIGVEIVRLNQRIAVAIQGKVPVPFLVHSLAGQELGAVAGNLQPLVLGLHLVVQQ